MTPPLPGSPRQAPLTEQVKLIGLIRPERRNRDQKRYKMLNKDDKKTNIESGRRQMRCSVCLGLLLSALLSSAAFAYPPYDNVPMGMDQATYDALTDSVMEWDEIENRIRYFNPMYSAAAEQIDSSMNDIQSSLGADIMNLRDQLYTVEDTLDELYESQKEIELSLPEGSPQREMALKQLGEAISTAKAGRQELKAGLDTLSDTNAQLEGRLINADAGTSMSRESMERQLYPVLEQLRSVIEGLFISYEQLSVSREMVLEQVSLYERLLSVQQGLFAQGLCTEAEVKAAQAQLEAARADLSSMDSSLSQLATAIGLQLGYTTETVPTIGKVPEPDLEYLAAADPSVDINKAAGENSTVRSAGATDGSYSGNARRDRNENVAMNQLTSKLSELYADMKQKELLYESSKTTMQKAERTRSSADTMYAMGMLSTAEYQAQMLAYTSYKASAELAGLSLTQSINNYKWAVDGVVSLE